jgi:hypothetical protein
VRISLDASVLMSACLRKKSAARTVVEQAIEWRWQLVTSLNCRQRVAHGLRRAGKAGREEWGRLEARLLWAHFPIAEEHPALLAASRTNRVLVGAMVDRSNVLLTSRRGGWRWLVGRRFCGLLVATPEEFLRRHCCPNR